MQLPRQTTTFSLAFKDLPNLHFISYDDGLMKVANLLFFITCKLIVGAFSLSGSFCFCFEVESEYRS